MHAGIRKGLAAVAGCLALSGIVGTPVASAAVVPAASASRPSIYEAGADQHVSADGTFADLTVANPRLARQDPSTEAQIAVESADGKQIVQLGWIVFRQQFRDTRTHLFAEVWINGRSPGIDADFQSLPGGCQPGVVLRPGAQRTFAILQHAGGWWVMFGGRWCGLFPDALWHNEFTKASVIYWEGLVDAASARPCTQMGDGKWASNPSAAEFSHIALYSGPNGKTALPAFRTFSNDARLYSRHTVNRTTFRFGGGGAC
jgi:hypothetical protein